MEDAGPCDVLPGGGGGLRVLPQRQGLPCEIALLSLDLYHNDADDGCAN